MILLGRDKEQRLVKQLRNGEDGAMKTFYSLYAPHLRTVVARYITDKEDVKDVLQEALLKIVTNIATFEYQGAGSLKAWATRITVNEALKFLRDAKHQEMTGLYQNIADETEEDIDDPPIEDVPPEEIMRMVRLLPTGYRTVFNLYVFEDRSHQEISELLGITPVTSRSQLHRAKALLAEMIQTYHDNKKPPQ